MQRLLKNTDTTARVSSVGWGKRTTVYGGLDDGGRLCHLPNGEAVTEEHDEKLPSEYPVL
jgi:hypothetical protein